jgi:hypothetical protein
MKHLLFSEKKGFLGFERPFFNRYTVAGTTTTPTQPSPIEGEGFF